MVKGLGCPHRTGRLHICVRGNNTETLQYLRQRDRDVT
jgi:hypothetical protein